MGCKDCVYWDEPDCENCDGCPDKDFDKPKPATDRSAEELAYKLQEFAEGFEIPKMVTAPEVLRFYETAKKAKRDEWVKIIEADRASQRQAGREEMRSELVEGYAANILELAKRYAALVEAARPFAQYEDGCALKMYDPARVRLGKALRDLDEGRKG